ncbi:MAG: hypothetical protein ACK49D_00830 [Flavobacteriia bacterium]|jgi:hypothetical protein
MAVRLIDCGIPNFELKKKRYELQESNEVALIDEEPTSKKKKKYAYKDDADGQLEIYKKILRRIPAIPGKLMLISGADPNIKIVEILTSDYNMREDFRTSRKINEGEMFDRFNWLMFKLRNCGHHSIRFVLAFEV